MIGRTRSRALRISGGAGRSVLFAGLALLSVGCGDGGVGDAVVQAPAAGREADAVEVPTGAAEGSVDWSAREAALDLEGWSVDFCPGEAPFLCVEREGRPVGSVERVSWAVADDALVRSALAGGGGEAAALRAVADEHLAVIAEDRRAGLGAGYSMRTEGPEPVTVAGRPGMRWGFIGSVEGRTLERTRHYATIASDSVHLFAATATDRSADEPGEGAFTLEDLAAFQPHLDRIVASSRLE